MKILFISDTHGFHDELFIYKDIDMIVHSGDYSNIKNPHLNQSEVIKFLEWFDKIPVKYKIMIAGNHDGSLELDNSFIKEYKSIVYLQHEFIEIAGLKIFGSPYTPEFCNWAFNVRRDQLHEYWKDIPSDLDILITHGPPKGILDIGEHFGNLEYCGCKALMKKVLEVKPKIHCFGHIHNNHSNINSGTRMINDIETIFINASCVTDGKFSNGLSSHGTTIDL